MGRIYIKDAKPGNEVILRGWVDSIRDLGNLKFFILRDRSGKIQITAKKGIVSDKLLEFIESLGREDCVEVKGKVIESKVARAGIEVIPISLKVLSTAEKPLPMEFSDVKSEKETRFEYRFLDLRNENISKLFWIRHKMVGYVHEYFRKQGFIEVHTPVIQAAGAEGGATLFKVNYYGKDAFLRQSPQLYKQILMASGMDKVYEIGQAFRAEKFHTRRHVSEFLSVDAEIAWIDSEEDVLKVIEELVVYLLKACNRDDFFREAGIKFNVPEIPFKRITYDEALSMLEKEGIEIEWGKDFEDKEEKILGDVLAKKGYEWCFIKRYPAKIKPFYIMMDNEYSRGFDFDYRGMELASGGQREHRYETLVKVMREKGLRPENFKFYLDAFRYGMPPHGGFGLGLERLIEQIMKLPDIKEIILFPRTPEQLVP
ncbi:MAG TPA: aspartate--tRNA(Asn) ligase [Candidatus Aenigmarchaeota archaeon]|nr:MAG: aspartate--tRNA(Asn) ligase [Candidatus Aenigmarchaeota archaeon]HDD46322.1 aspartate--tRNA(Asn) ligase [Candidatus Aenigmarchaeota archaeon]